MKSKNEFDSDSFVQVKKMSENCNEEDILLSPSSGISSNEMANKENAGPDWFLKLHGCNLLTAS